MTGDDVRALVADPLRRGAVPAVELAQILLARLEQAQPRLKAMITITPELALDAAQRVDGERARGRRPVLDGMPIVIKDNIDVAGVPTTVGSRLFTDRMAESDAEVTLRLRAAGAVILGKANMHELAFGATSRNEAFGHVANPAAPDRIPGGSSGGSGAALAAGLCAGALGTDTGGSIRLPAAFCGVTGLRPTYGAVSTRGVFPVARSLDTVGPLARSAADLAALLGVIAGFDARDPWAVAGDLPNAVAGLEDGVAGVRVGLPSPFFLDDLAPDVERSVSAASEVLASLGADLVTVELPGGEQAAVDCSLLIRVEALALHEHALAEHPDSLESGTRARLELARDVPALELARAHERAAVWRSRVAAALKGVDLLLLPTTPGPAPPADGAETIATTAAVVPFTHALSLAHVPCLSLPCGATADGVPLGAQLAAARFGEPLLVRAAAAFQSVTDWHRRSWSDQLTDWSDSARIAP